MATFDPFGYEHDFNRVLQAIAAVQASVNKIYHNQSTSLAAMSIEIASISSTQNAQGVTLDSIVTKLEKVMATLDDLVASVAAETTTIAGLTTFIQGLRDQIDGVGLALADQAKIDAIFANLKSNDAALAAALDQNVPPVGPVSRKTI